MSSEIFEFRKMMRNFGLGYAFMRIWVWLLEEICNLVFFSLCSLHPSLCIYSCYSNYTSENWLENQWIGIVLIKSISACKKKYMRTWNWSRFIWNSHVLVVLLFLNIYKERSNSKDVLHPYDCHVLCYRWSLEQKTCSKYS